MVHRGWSLRQQRPKEMAMSAPQERERRAPARPEKKTPHIKTRQRTRILPTLLFNFFNGYRIDLDYRKKTSYQKGSNGQDIKISDSFDGMFKVLTPASPASMTPASNGGIPVSGRIFLPTTNLSQEILGWCVSSKRISHGRKQADQI